MVWELRAKPDTKRMVWVVGPVVSSQWAGDPVSPSSTTNMQDRPLDAIYAATHKQEDALNPKSETLNPKT